MEWTVNLVDVTKNMALISTVRYPSRAKAAKVVSTAGSRNVSRNQDRQVYTVPIDPHHK